MNIREEFTFLPELVIGTVTDSDTLTIDGFKFTTNIEEMNFYTQLNSFAMRADVTFQDMQNAFISKLNQNPQAVTLKLYSVENFMEHVRNKDSSDFICVFEAHFLINKVTILKFDMSLSPTSTVKLDLCDLYEPTIFNRLRPYSNFNVRWDSDQMSVQNTLNAIVEPYTQEIRKNEIKFHPKLFDTQLDSLRRRLYTSPESTLEETLIKYIDSLYDPTYSEFLTKDTKAMVPLSTPKSIIAYCNKYSLKSKKGTSTDKILDRQPWLVAINNMDCGETKPFRELTDREYAYEILGYTIPREVGNVYSLPDYDPNEFIGQFAQNQVDIAVADTVIFDSEIDFNDKNSGEEKAKLLAENYIQYKFDPKNNIFIRSIDTPVIDQNSSFRKYILPHISNIETSQSPKYLGTGKLPKFTQEYLLKIRPTDKLAALSIYKQNKYYVQNNNKSVYSEFVQFMLRPMVLVTMPKQAWHSPGQEIDFRMSRLNLKDNPAVSMFTMNKLLSGKWKILQSTTTFKKISDEMPGINSNETIGISRFKYLDGEP